jgi:hypothetical protein
MRLRRTRVRKPPKDPHPLDFARESFPPGDPHAADDSILGGSVALPPPPAPKEK